MQIAECLPDAQGVLVTAGGSGAAYAFTDAAGTTFTGHVPVYDVDVQDTTGAGDAFTCGFLSYILREVRFCTMRARPGNSLAIHARLRLAILCTPASGVQRLGRGGGGVFARDRVSCKCLFSHVSCKHPARLRRKRSKRRLDVLQKEGKANKEGVQKLLHSPEVVEKAVGFAAACGALTTLNSGAISAQPKLQEIEKLVAERGVSS